MGEDGGGTAVGSTEYGVGSGEWDLGGELLGRWLIGCGIHLACLERR